MDVFDPVTLGPLRLRNRLIKAATFEGMSPAGIPSPQLIEHHREIARGGTALTTLAYCAVSPAGRTFEHQLHLRPEAFEPLRRLTDAVHSEGGGASIQLSHAGFFSRLRAPDGRVPRGPSRTFNAFGAGSGLPYAPAMTPEDIERVIQDFERAASEASELGFDALELHLGHGYLLSQFISPATNRRRDEWGGSLENRLRFPLAVVERVRGAVGPDVALLAKINLSDGFEGGLEIDDALGVARALEATGALDALVLSGGFTSRSAFYLLRGGLPLAQLAEAQDGAIARVSMRLLGGVLVKGYPFEPRFFLPLARRLRAAVKMPLVALGGYVSRDDLHVARDEGFELVALGRALIADPDLPRRMASGELSRTRCNACNECIVQAELGGLRCVL